MDDLAHQNGAAANGQRLVSIGGRDYLASPPTEQDFGTLHAELRQYLQNPIAAVAADLALLPPQYREAAVKAAVELKAGGGATMTPAFVTEQLHKPRGCAVLAWLMVRKAHPDVTLAELKQAVTEENVTDVLAALGAASGMEAADPKAGRPPGASG